MAQLMQQGSFSLPGGSILLPLGELSVSQGNAKDTAGSSVIASSSSSDSDSDSGSDSASDSNSSSSCNNNCANKANNDTH